MSSPLMVGPAAICRLDVQTGENISTLGATISIATTNGTITKRELARAP